MLEEFNQFSGSTVLVTGATGFTGRVLAHKLAKAGANLRIIARESSDIGDLAEICLLYTSDAADE